jgi:septal ring factor EnvC (AmiA/AmiB activator)
MRDTPTRIERKYLMDNTREPEKNNWLDTTLLRSLISAGIIALISAVILSWSTSQNAVSKAEFIASIGELNKKIAITEANYSALLQRLERIESKIDAIDNKIDGRGSR